MKKCCLCGKPIAGYGNNPEGIVKEILLGNRCRLEKFKPGDVCCDECNRNTVIPHRVFVIDQHLKVIE